VNVDNRKVTENIWEDCKMHLFSKPRPPVVIFLLPLTSSGSEKLSLLTLRRTAPGVASGTCNLRTFSKTAVDTQGTSEAGCAACARRQTPALLGSRWPVTGLLQPVAVDSPSKQDSWRRDAAAQ